MTTATLLHSKSRLVTLDELDEIRAPAPSGNRHLPIKHSVVVQALGAALTDSHWRVLAQKWAVGGKGDVKLFGVLDIETDNGVGVYARDGQRLSVGFRHANDRTLSMRMTAGTHVMVCDNLCMSGSSIVLTRKHTKGVDLDNEMFDAMPRLTESLHDVNGTIDRLSDTRLSDEDARDVLWSMFLEQSVLPITSLPSVSEFYFRTPFDAEDAATVTDIAPRSAFGLLNAVTRELRTLPPHRIQTVTGKVTKFFEREFFGAESTEVEDEDDDV